MIELLKASDLFKSILLLEIFLPAKLSSNPNQIHLKQPIKRFSSTR